MLFLFILGISILMLTSCSREAMLRWQLNRIGLEWTQDTDGDYRTEVTLPDGDVAEVGITAHSDKAGDYAEFRTVWSVAARVPGELPRGLAENLMVDSWTSRTAGFWAIAGTTSDNRIVLVYTVRIPEDASRHVMEAAIMDAARSASSMSLALVGLEEQN